MGDRLWRVSREFTRPYARISLLDGCWLVVLGIVFGALTLIALMELSGVAVLGPCRY